MTEENSVSSLCDRALAAAREERWDDACELLDRILDADSEHLRALDLYGFVCFFQGRHERGEQLCRRVLDIEPGRAYAMKGLGLHLARQGKLDEGRAYLEKAIAKSFSS